ncbi:hypothetical protein MKQ70_32100 [Chitinophaga sedimenti]|uniref:hypothetical protein n=1 Tax=Chitinophaga sedimenti TaxID=2033606 RepID=UPI002003505B|nr:hypothetical protein [Chitinophaga sedimenti]MCK7559361.1 hypothetical protein [Chitinophaga sedimenti]
MSEVSYQCADDSKFLLTNESGFKSIISGRLSLPPGNKKEFLRLYVLANAFTSRIHLSKVEDLLVQASTEENDAALYDRWEILMLISKAGDLMEIKNSTDTDGEGLNIYRKFVVSEKVYLDIPG